jgi:hypothetical protein
MGVHGHALNKTEFSAAAFRAELNAAVEEDLQLDVKTIHQQVLDRMGYVTFLIRN